MTNNLKCPFCGAELESRKLLSGMVDYVCTNIQCDFSYIPLTMKWWQALIDGKAAQDALNALFICLNTIKDWDCDNPKQPYNQRPYQVKAIQNYAKNKINEIESILKG